MQFKHQIGFHSTSINRNQNKKSCYFILFFFSFSRCIVCIVDICSKLCQENNRKQMHCIIFGVSFLHRRFIPEFYISTLFTQLFEEQWNTTCTLWIFLWFHIYNFSYDFIFIIFTPLPLPFLNIIPRASYSWV